jgi:hypothetical protein
MELARAAARRSAVRTDFRRALGTGRLELPNGGVRHVVEATRRALDGAGRRPPGLARRRRSCEHLMGG